MANQRIVNPECRDGKHGNCDGHGWDMDADTAVRCPCTCHRCPACGHPTHPVCWDARDVEAEAQRELERGATAGINLHTTRGNAWDDPGWYPVGQ